MKRLMVEKRLFSRLGAVMLLGCLLSSSLNAQKSSLLWEISGKGLDKSSYLYGTVHLICASDFVIGDATKVAFEQVEQIVLELDMDDPKEMSSLQMSMMAPGGIDYQGMMSEEDYAKLDSTLTATTGMGMSVLKMSKPFGLMSALYMSVLDCGQPESYELSFIQMAKAQEKELLGLETSAFQVSIFDNIPMEEQVKWLLDMINKPEDGKEEWDKMMVAYKAQDIEALYSALGSSPEYAQYEDELLTNRNANWISKMEVMAKDMSTFFAVGAAHLGGDTGVINLLKKAGYTVKPVANN